MPELLLELFSEEIPARMQVRAAEDLARLVGEAFSSLAPQDVRRFSGPRRIAVAATVAHGVAESRQSERGPRVSAPEQALAGFLRKHGASRDDLRQQGDFWVLDRTAPGVSASALIAREMPGLLRHFPWPKSMRWGGSSAFTWVRPLRRILCILDGAVVPFDLRQGEDDGHGLASDNLTEGHRFLSPGAFAITSAAQWRDELRARRVIADAAERRALVADGIAAKAAEHGSAVVQDAGLLDEVAGLVEWPVPLLGRIDTAFMDLPPEVMQVSMRVNQRYFALRDARDEAAPCFAFAANVEASDGGAAIVAGNERVLRARFSDARHFWDLDRRTKLADRVPALDAISFHAKLGSQGDRVRRLVRIAGALANLVGADSHLAQRAALLCKADLTTGMVGEFPELQGIMGGYYSLHDHEPTQVSDAIRGHYSPKGPADTVPTASVTVAVALADKLDQLVQFFRIGERPTGSGDPFALRRAALGVLRLLNESAPEAGFMTLFQIAGAGPQTAELSAFLKERLRIQWRDQGRRHDYLEAVFTVDEDRLDHLSRRVNALQTFLQTPQGCALLNGYRRAANILRQQEGSGGALPPGEDFDLLDHPDERHLAAAHAFASEDIKQGLAAGHYVEVMHKLGNLPNALDSFFSNVQVDSPIVALRENRLRLLASVANTMNQVADFSKIEG